MPGAAPFRLLPLLVLAACAAEPTAPPPVAAAATTADSPPPTGATAAVPAGEGVRVVFLGDSLTAGLGLSSDLAYPARIEAGLEAAGLPVVVVNAGVSGDTTAGGLRRVDWILKQAPDVVVVALGANDMLRGVPPAQVRANLDQIVERVSASGARVVLAGMRANPSLGPDYVAAFDPIYPELAAARGLPLVPFLLEGIAGEPTLNQADGIHPTAAGQEKIAAMVRTTLEPVVREVSSGRGTPK